jgi:hypothetical protein
MLCKIWFLQVLDNLKSISNNLNQNRLEAQHVAPCDSFVPVQVDQGHGALDLKRNMRSRLAHIPSLSDLIWASRSRSDGDWERRRRGLIG